MSPIEIFSQFSFINVCGRLGMVQSLNMHPLIGTGLMLVAVVKQARCGEIILVATRFLQTILPIV